MELSIDFTSCSWVLGTKHKNRINDELLLQVGTMEGIDGLRLCALTLITPEYTAQIGLCGFEAVQIGNALVEIGHKLEILAELDCLDRGFESHGYKPVQFERKTRFGLRRRRT
jgi:hypothetical protein